MIPYIVAYGASFFNDTMEPLLIDERPSVYSLPVEVVLYVSSACEEPFKNIAYAFQLSPCLSYQVETNRRIVVVPRAPENFRCSRKELAFSFLLVIPLKIMSLALKILLFLSSAEFRKMQSCLVQEHLLRTKKIAINNKEAPGLVLGIPRAILANYGDCFSVQDLGRLEQVSKDLHGVAPAMWHNKAKQLLPIFTEGDPKEAIKEKFRWMEVVHWNRDFIKALGGEERILRFPVPNPSHHLSDSTHPQTKEFLKENSIVRTDDCSEFVFRCRDTESNEEGILVIQKSKHSKTYNCFWSMEGDFGNLCEMNFENLNELFRGKPSKWKKRTDRSSTSHLTLQLV